MNMRPVFLTEKCKKYPNLNDRQETSKYKIFKQELFNSIYIIK